MELLHYIMIASDLVLRKKNKKNKKKKNEGIFPLGISSVNVTESAVWPNQQDLVTFTKEIFNGKLHFLCSGCRKLCSVLNRSHKPCVILQSIVTYPEPRQTSTTEYFYENSQNLHCRYFTLFCIQ